MKQLQCRKCLAAFKEIESADAHRCDAKKDALSGLFGDKPISYRIIVVEG